MQKTSETIVVVAAALIRADDRVLLQQRRFSAAQGGLWEFPGGKVEPGENPEAALSRELAEELGIDAAPGDLSYLSRASEAGNPHEIQLFICRQWQGEPVCLAGEAIAWLAPADLLTREMPPLDVPLARDLIAALQSPQNFAQDRLAKPE